VRKKTEKHPNARPIDELAADVRALLVAILPKADYFALQLDESTDVSNDSQLLAFVWLSTKMRCRRNLYCVSSCMDVQKSSQIFKVIDIFFLEFFPSILKLLKLLNYLSLSEYRDKMSIINRINGRKV